MGPTLVHYEPASDNEAEHFAVTASNGRINGKIVFKFAPECQQEDVVFFNPGNTSPDVAYHTITATGPSDSVSYSMGGSVEAKEAELSQLKQVPILEPTHSLQGGTSYFFPVYRMLSVPLIEKLTRTSFFNRVIENCKTIEAGDDKMNFATSQIL